MEEGRPSSASGVWRRGAGSSNTRAGLGAAFLGARGQARIPDPGHSWPLVQDPARVLVVAMGHGQSNTGSGLGPASTAGVFWLRLCGPDPEPAAREQEALGLSQDQALKSTHNQRGGRACGQGSVRSSQAGPSGRGGPGLGSWETAASLLPATAPLLCTPHGPCWVLPWFQDAGSGDRTDLHSCPGEAPWAAG